MTEHTHSAPKWIVLVILFVILELLQWMVGGMLLKNGVGSILRR